MGPMRGIRRQRPWNKGTTSKNEKGSHKQVEEEALSILRAMKVVENTSDRWSTKRLSKLRNEEKNTTRWGRNNYLVNKANTNTMPNVAKDNILLWKQNNRLEAAKRFRETIRKESVKEQKACKARVKKKATVRRLRHNNNRVSQAGLKNSVSKPISNKTSATSSIIEREDDDIFQWESSSNIRTLLPSKGRDELKSSSILENKVAHGRMHKKKPSKSPKLGTKPKLSHRVVKELEHEGREAVDDSKKNPEGSNTLFPRLNMHTILGDEETTTTPESYLSESDDPLKAHIAEFVEWQNRLTKFGLVSESKCLKLPKVKSKPLRRAKHVQWSKQVDQLEVEKRLSMLESRVGKVKLHSPPPSGTIFSNKNVFGKELHRETNDSVHHESDKETEMLGDSTNNTNKGIIRGDSNKKEGMVMKEISMVSVDKPSGRSPETTDQNDGTSDSEESYSSAFED